MLKEMGGKRGFVTNALSTAALLASRYSRFEQVNWDRVTRLVFTCKGNICRSAYGEARALALGLSAISAGIGACDGGPADRAAILHARQRGLTLERHRTTRWSGILPELGDLVLCMEPGQARAVEADVQAAGAQLSLLGLWSKPRRPWLFDPYGLSDAYWSRCLDTIDDAVRRIGTLAIAAKRSDAARS